MAISADVRLQVYNEALRILGSRKLASITEDRKPRHLLDDALGSDNNGVVTCLERADWNFATRTLKAEYDPGVEPAFGFQRAYQKPDDLVRLTTITADEYFGGPLMARDYTDEAGYWFSDVEPLYVRYVSDGDSFGLNSGGWPRSFKKYLAAYLAEEICEAITNSTDKLQVCRLRMKEAMAAAKSRDAMDEGVKFFPTGSWVGSRGGFDRRRHRTVFE